MNKSSLLKIHLSVAYANNFNASNKIIISYFAIYENNLQCHEKYHEHALTWIVHCF